MIRKSACALALALLAQPAAAQLSSPSVAALGMGDNYTAGARGFSSMAWNPANLGLSGNPGSSFQFLTFRGLVGVDPVTLTDIAEFGGEIVPFEIKSAWQRAIDAEGTQQGTSGFDGNWLSLQIGNFGFQASTSARAVASFSPGITRLLMFGNTDQTGTPQTISLSNSSMDVTAYSTGAVSYAMPFAMSNGAAKLSIGATAKYTLGHIMAMGDESTGSASASPTAVTLQFPVVYTQIPEDSNGDPDPMKLLTDPSGSGFGLDIGAAYESGKITIGATVQNIVNSFEWDEARLRFVPGSLRLNRDVQETQFEEQPFVGATGVPTALKARILDQKFKPVIAVGTAYQMSNKMRVTGDVRMGSADGIRTGPKTHAGAGLEYRLMSWLPVRVGAAYLQLDDENNGSQLGGGLGIDLAGFNLAASAQRRTTNLGHDTVVMITLFSHGM